MAKTFGQVTKIYELKTLNFDQVHKNLEQIAKDFEAIKKAKRDAETGIANSKTTEELSRYRAELQKVKIEEADLRKQRQQMINDAKAEQLARQAIINQQKEEKKNAEAAVGSYAALYRQYKQLYDLVKNTPKGNPVTFQGSTLEFDKAIVKLKELSAAEQDFRRQFQRDQLLVGEYTSGIVQAFKQMGLDDLIGGQITKSQARLNDLNGNFERLKNELSEVKVTGKGSLEAIEKELIDNRKEAIALNQQVGQLQNELRGVGGIGNQISSSIGQGFKDARQQLTQFVLGYVSFQALLQGVTKTFDTTVDLDSLDSSLKVVSQTEDELATNQKFLADTTQRLGLEYTTTAVAFKNFYAAGTQAGLSAQQTRDIFESAAAAAANLKLSTENTNGVLLAFGQIASKGKVQAEELRGQIGERIPGAFAIAARAIGVTEEQLNKMLQNGEVIAKDFLPKFGVELRKTFGGNTKDQIEGLQASVSRLKNQFTSLIQDNQQGLTNFFKGFINSVGLLIQILPTLIKLGALLLAGWIIQNTGLVLLNASLFTYNLLILRNIIVMGLLSPLYYAQAIAVGALNVATRLAAAAMRLFGISTAAATGPIRIIIAVIGLLAAAALGISKAFAGAATAIDRNTQRLRLLNDLTKEATAATAEQRAKTESLVKAIKDASVSEETRNKILKDLIAIDPIFQKALVDGKINYEKLTEALKEYNKNLLQKATLEAAASRVSSSSKELQRLINIRSTLEEIKTGVRGKGFGDLPEEVQDVFVNDGLINVKGFKGISNLLNVDVSDKSVNKAIVNVNRLIDAQKNLAQSASDAYATLFVDDVKQGDTKAPTVFERFKQLLAKDGSETDFETLLKDVRTQKGQAGLFSKEFKDLKKLEDEIENLLNPKNKKARASRLSGPQKDALADIDALRDQQLAEERALRAQNLESEENYLLQLRDINIDAIDAKLKIIKGANAAERKLIAELQLERITQEQETNNKLYDLRRQQLKAELDTRTEELRRNNDRIQQDPTISNSIKAESQLLNDRRILNLHEIFNGQMDALEKQLGQQSIKNAKERNDAILKLEEDLRIDRLKLVSASIKDVEAERDKTIAQFSALDSQQRLNILENDNLSPDQKDRRLQRLDSRSKIGVLGAEIDALQKNLPKYKKAFEEKQITETEYLDKLTEFNDKQSDLIKESEKEFENFFSKVTDLQSIITKGIQEVFNFKPDSKEGKAVAIGVAAAYSTALDVMNNYFDAEKARIQQSMELAKERIDREKEQLLARAQSKAEEVSIEKQAAAKKKQIERDAFEKQKDIKKKEAKIAFLMELANIWSSVWQVGPVAGAILGAVLTGLAGLRYASTINNINTQQYAYGGQPGAVPTRGGTFGGKQHKDGGTPFTFKDNTYEAEVDELSIIRTRNAARNKIYSVVGTQKQIASAMNVAGGGISFAPGAKFTKFAYGGNLGDSLQAPQFTPAISNTTASIGFSAAIEIMKVQTEAITEQAKSIQAVSNRIDRLEVVQVTSSVTKAQKKVQQQSEIGTL